MGNITRKERQHMAMGKQGLEISIGFALWN